MWSIGRGRRRADRRAATVAVMHRARWGSGGEARESVRRHLLQPRSRVTYMICHRTVRPTTRVSCVGVKCGFHRPFGSPMNALRCAVSRVYRGVKWGRRREPPLLETTRHAQKAAPNPAAPNPRLPNAEAYRVPLRVGIVYSEEYYRVWVCVYLRAARSALARRGEVIVLESPRGSAHARAVGGTYAAERSTCTIALGQPVRYTTVLETKVAREKYTLGAQAVGVGRDCRCKIRSAEASRNRLREGVVLGGGVPSTKRKVTLQREADLFCRTRCFSGARLGPKRA